MPELVTSRWLAVADVLGEAHVDRDEGVYDVDCEEVLNGAQYSVEPVRAGYMVFVMRSGNILVIMV